MSSYSAENSRQPITSHDSGNLQLKSGATACFTIATQNRMHYALNLIASIREFHSDIPCFIIRVDGDCPVQESHCGIDYLTPEQLQIPSIHRFLFQYDLFELSCALKPFAFRYLASVGFSRLVYFDSDIQVYSSLDDIFRSLDEHQILLTPHITSPIPNDDLEPSTATLRKAGAYNAGFIAVRIADSSLQFLNWWCSLCAKSCIVDCAAGIHVDQGWLDLVPGLFHDVQIVKCSGWNVAYWNVSARMVARDKNGVLLAGDSVLVFYHFSGFVPDSPATLSKHQHRVSTAVQPCLLEVLNAYAERLQRFGREKYEQLGCALTVLNDGTPVSPLWREAIRTDHPLLAGVENPFDIRGRADLKWRLKRAAIDVCESRQDWKIAAESFLDGIVQRVPFLSDMFLKVRRRIRGRN